jgi:hypothetical protein
MHSDALAQYNIANPMSWLIAILTGRPLADRPQFGKNNICGLFISKDLLPDHAGRDHIS